MIVVWGCRDSPSAPDKLLRYYVMVGQHDIKMPNPAIDFFIYYSNKKKEQHIVYHVNETKKNDILYVFLRQVFVKLHKKKSLE